jgi:hypothetical protein
MGTTRYVRRFVIDLTIDTKLKNPISDYLLQHAIRESLSNLNQKKYKIGDVSVCVAPISDFTEKALDLLETLRSEMREQAQNEIVSHMECEHDELD